MIIPGDAFLPEISLVVPVYNTDPRHLSELVDSIRFQTLESPRYEVVFYNDASTDDTLGKLDDLTDGMDQVRVYTGRTNLGISEATNQAIEYSGGNIIALADHDDRLKPHALETVLRFTEEHPEVVFGYSDHVIIDGDGKYMGKKTPHEFDPEKLLHFHFTEHLKFFQRGLFYQIGGFESKYSDCQDYAFSLTSDEVLDEGEIRRLPEVLYEFRVHGDNTSLQRRPRIRSSVTNLLTEALDRRGIKAEVWFDHKRGVDQPSYYDWRVINKEEPALKI